MKTQKWSAKMLATAAVCIAMSYLLSFVRLVTMPMGGSVTVASMLPVMLFSWLYGVGPGVIAGLAYGLLQFIQEAEIYHWVQMIFDYPLAFAMLGLAGCFRKIEKPWALPVGVVIACFGRFLCHLFTGIVFFGEYAPTQTFAGIFTYSLLYNGGYMLVETIVSAFISALSPVRSMVKRLARM